MSVASSFSEKEKKEIDDIVRTSSDGEAVFSDRFLGDHAGRYIFQKLKKADTQGPSTVDAKGCYMGLESGLAVAELLKSPTCKLAKLR